MRPSTIWEKTRKSKGFQVPISSSYASVHFKLRRRNQGYAEIWKAVREADRSIRNSNPTKQIKEAFDALKFLEGLPLNHSPNFRKILDYTYAPQKTRIGLLGL